jgi:hypothetical protein
MSKRKENEKNPEPSMTKQAILRRIDFIIREARCEDGIRDQTVTFAMRVVSNWCTLGKDAGAAEVKLKGRRMSRKAYDLRVKYSSDLRTWASTTINEHQMPLDHFWKRIRGNKIPSPEELLADFQRWLMVTVTKDEDDKVRKLRDKDPIERYGLAGIEVGEMSDDGKWKPLVQSLPVYLSSD